MPTPLLTLWIDGQNNSLLTGWEAQALAILPTLKQGDSVGIEVHLVSTSKGLSFMEEVEFEPNSIVRVAVGRNDQKPSTGYLIFGYDGDTVEVPYSTPIVSTLLVPVSVNSLINGMPSIAAAGGVVVSIVNGFTYRIVFNEIGVRSEITCDSTNLRPTSTTLNKRIIVGSPTSKDVQHIKPKVIPVAYQETFTDSPAPTIVISYPSPAITRVSIKPQPKYGSFVISNGTLTTGPISINATSDELLNELTLVGINDTSVTPTGSTYSALKVGPFDWDVSRTSGPVETLSVSSTGLVGFKSKYGFLSLNNEEVEDILAGASSVSATIEVEVSNSAGKHTAYQGPITIVNDLIDNQTFSPTELPSLVTDAPINGIQYARKDGTWTPVELDGNNIPDYNNGLTYTVGNQVYYEGKIYRMIVAVGAAGYDPVLHPSYWESLSGSNPDLSGYVEKTGAVMSLGASLNFLNSFSELSIGAGGVGVYSNTNPESVLLFENRLEVSNGTNTTKVVPTGITFPDTTIQTTAAVSPDLSNYLTKSGNLSGITDASQARSNIGVYSTLQVDTSLANKSDVGHNHNFFQLQKVDGGSEPYTDFDGSFLRIYNGGSGGGNNFVTIRESNSWVFPYFGQPMPVAYIQGTWSKDDGFGNASSGTVTISVSFSKYLFRLNTGVVEFGTRTGPSMHSWTQTVPNWYLGTEAYGDRLSVYADDSLDAYNWTYQDLAEGISASASVSFDSGTVMPSWSEITWSNNSFNYEFAKNKSNSYDEPVVKRGLIPSLIQELIREKAFSFSFDPSGVTKYGLIWDASTGKFLLDLYPNLNSYAKLAGDTFTGKVFFTPVGGNAGINVGIGGTSTSATTAGDLWITTGGANLNFRDGTGALKILASLQNGNTFTQPQAIVTPTTATLPALRITNQSLISTAYSIVVEDQNNPDSDATIVDASGNVGIGVSNNPASPWVVDAKLAIKSASGSALPLVKLTQTGSGACLVVEDEASPDTSQFIIGNDGRVGIGGSVASSVLNKLAVYNGNILLTSGFGINFGTGSTQTVPYIPSAVAITGGTIDNITLDGGTF